jgi:CRP-like cAMP-binding protein
MLYVVPLALETLLKRVPLFAKRSKRDLERIAKLADEIDLPQGKVLTKQGDRGHEFFVIVEGSAEVRRGGHRSTLWPTATSSAKSRS